MRTATLALLAALAAAPSPARAQRSNRNISLESVVSSPGRAPAAGLALGASTWLEGDVHATARLAWTVAAEPGGRATAGAVGLAWAPGATRLRPRVFAEVGWTRRSAGVAGDLAVGAGAGLEWFIRREVSLTAGGALRRSPRWTPELAGGVRVGF